MPKNKSNYKRENSNRHFHKKFARNQPKTMQQQINRQHHQNQFKEIEVGITRFVSDLEGFSGIIKARFSDFQVNEIALDGTVAKLTDTSIPKDFETKDQTEIDPASIVESPSELIPQETWDAIRTLISSSEAPPVVELDISESTKEQRTKIHETIKSIYGKKISANTLTRDETTKVMEFKKHDPKDACNKRFKWPEDKGEYVHFLVYKESLDTLEASFKIADCVRISASHFNYAGVKDKRAKTTQWFSIRKVEPRKLIKKTKPLRNIKIGNITFKDEPLKLGQLSGNRFRIALRNISGSDELIGEAMNFLREKGFINYYGLQRFGNNKDVPTVEIGVNLLLGKWKEACDIILKSTEHGDPTSDVTKAKKVYNETKDFGKALKEFDNSKNRCIEFYLLTGLSKSGQNDYVNALESIPRNMRLLYIHSFQSLVWNHMASKRVENFGFDAVPGDLVLQEAEAENCKESDGNDGIVDFDARVKVLTEEECSKYSIHDIVLPLPGYDIVYPENLKSEYKNILESHGLTLEMPKQKVETYSLSGAYRKLLGQVKNLSWKVLRYTDPHANLIRSDFEELKGDKEPEDIEDGKYRALVIDFCLSPSCYATMALREILKTDTSNSSQSKLNDYHNTPKEPAQVLDKIEEDSFNDKVGLLSDKEKYEEFKSLVFSGGPLKRKIEDEEKDDEKVVKLSKADNK